MTLAVDVAPDWSQESAAELCCPLCEYNLRGLEQPRCPECGFAFTWAELIRGQQQQHAYLFEHQTRRNVWSFWKTYWNDCRPRQFWMNVNPAQPVRMGRLLLYWMIANTVWILSFVLPFALNYWDAIHAPRVSIQLFFANPLTSHHLRPRFVPAFTPQPPPHTFSQNLISAWQMTVNNGQQPFLLAGVITVLVWPWMTLAALLIFSQSMRRAKIRKRHVLRAVIYGTDYGLLILVPLFALKDARWSADFLLVVYVLCAAVTLYRVTFAYSRYMRFHLPFLTVLTSQILVCLVIFIAFLQVINN